MKVFRELFINKVHFVQMDMYFHSVTTGLQILTQKMLQFQLKTFLSTYGPLWAVSSSCFMHLKSFMLLFMLFWKDIPQETKNSGILLQETESKVTGVSDKVCEEVTMVLKAPHIYVLEHQDEACPNSWGL